MSCCRRRSAALLERRLGPEGRFGFLDARNARADGTKLIVCELTLRDGNVEWDLNGRAGEDWKAFYAPKPPGGASLR